MDEDLESWLTYTKDIVKLDKTNNLVRENIKPHIITIPHVRSNSEHVLDLHGLTQDQAFDKLKSFLKNSASCGKNEVVIVTGKGGINQPSPIKLAVPRWLQYTELSQYVFGYSQIQDKLGGSGSLRVTIKRVKKYEK